MEGDGEPCGVTVGHFSISEPSLAQVARTGDAKKAPAKRIATAVPDQKLAPEPR